VRIRARTMQSLRATAMHSTLIMMSSTVAKVKHCRSYLRWMSNSQMAWKTSILACPTREPGTRPTALYREATENGAERNSLSVLRSRWQVPSNDGPYERAVDLQKLRAHCFPERYCFWVSLFEVS
jgi:hypothetical protein